MKTLVRRTGTSHFVSKQAATLYYSDVDAAIADKSISIGIPTLPYSNKLPIGNIEKLVAIGGRWFVEEEHDTFHEEYKNIKTLAERIRKVQEIKLHSSYVVLRTDSPYVGNSKRFAWGKVNIHFCKRKNKWYSIVWDIQGNPAQTVENHSSNCPLSGIKFDDVYLVDDGKSWQFVLENHGYQVLGVI